MIRAVSFDGEDVDPARYPFSIPAIRSLTTLDLDPAVTLLTGENGSGKSTLVEAIAVAAGFSAEGGSRNMRHATRESHSELHRRLHLVHDGRGMRDGWFLRAESFFTLATHVERDHDATLLDSYGGVSLHEQSHGESFLALLLHRFGGRGLYILDEPEAALSVRGQLALMRRMHELAGAGSQFVVSTHSPILLAYPGARVYALDERGIAETPWQETDVVELTRSFLADRHRFLHYLFSEDAEGSAG
jgi:predicted ATPase